MSETINDHMPTTPDINQERLEMLKQQCPDWFTDEGELDIEEIKKAVNPESVQQTERFDFTWFGKAQAKRKAFTPSNATLKYDEGRSVNPDKADGNVIIEGENLEVLKLLLSSYREKVKCIYIDPPYNTGKDFVYSDNFREDKKEYWEQTGGTEEGVKVDTNMDTDGRFHSNWLSMIYSRLLLARQLLKEDGVIFISIDDNEQHNLRKLCNEIFGENNFISNICHKARASVSNDKIISENHNHILLYAKDRSKIFDDRFHFGKKKKIEGFDKKDDNGKYKLVPVDGPGGAKKGNPHYEFKGVEGYWRYSIETMKKLYDEDKIVVTDNNLQKKYYEKEARGKRKAPTTWWDEKFYTSTATKNLNKLIAKDVFNNPKNVRLLKKLIEISTWDKEGIVLDFFGGSGTLGHATHNLNEEDGGNRKFILVQLPEMTGKDSVAYEKGYNKISDITIERNKRVIEGYGDDLQPIDAGFKVYTLAKSHFPRVEFRPDPEKSEAENVEALKTYIAEKEAGMETMFNKQDIIDEVLLKNGFMLDFELTEQPEFDENDVFLATDDHRKALVCLDKELSEKTVEHFKGNDELKFICLERALNTSKKWNLKHYLGDKLNAM